MATEKDVRKYLAYWFQAGKSVISPQGKSRRPEPVISGDRYSAAFEDLWQTVLAQKTAYYLAGTDQTIADLLGESWEIAACARCEMPIPMASVGTGALTCPCNDLPTWPNFELPQPRSPISSTDRLNQLRDRLK
ncbi:MAG: hypothetical protein ACFB4J_02185 [Elainellaceae cyanobacterium]